jgi:hypothetical protein
MFLQRQLGPATVEAVSNTVLAADFKRMLTSRKVTMMRGAGLCLLMLQCQAGQLGQAHLQSLCGWQDTTRRPDLTAHDSRVQTKQIRKDCKYSTRPRDLANFSVQQQQSSERLTTADLDKR